MSLTGFLWCVNTHTHTQALLQIDCPSYGFLATESGAEGSVFSCPAHEQRRQTSSFSCLLLISARSLHHSNGIFLFSQTVGMKMLTTSDDGGNR